jgi:hypothetical protein
MNYIVCCAVRPVGNPDAGKWKAAQTEPIKPEPRLNRASMIQRANPAAIGHGGLRLPKSGITIATQSSERHGVEIASAMHRTL